MSREYTEEEARQMYEGVRRSAEFMRRTQDWPNFDGPEDEAFDLPDSGIWNDDWDEQDG